MIVSFSFAGCQAKAGRLAGKEIGTEVRITGSTIGNALVLL